MSDNSIDWDGHDRRQRNGWHVGREIPIAVIVALVIQTGGGIWWLANLAAKLDSVQYQLAELKTDRYTASDARRDNDLARLRDENLERRVRDLETRSTTP